MSRIDDKPKAPPAPKPAPAPSNAPSTASTASTQSTSPSTSAQGASPTSNQTQDSGFVATRSRPRAPQQASPTAPHQRSLAPEEKASLQSALWLGLGGMGTSSRIAAPTNATATSAPNALSSEGMGGGGTPTNHTVARGETLGRIAQLYNTSVDQLLLANPSLNGNPNLIRAGQVLALPQTGPNPSTHTVQQGENLFRIALKYGTDVNAMLAANPQLGGNPNLIRVGESLNIPAGASPTPAPPTAPSAFPQPPQPTAPTTPVTTPTTTPTTTPVTTPTTNTAPTTPATTPTTTPVSSTSSVQTPDNPFDLPRPPGRTFYNNTFGVNGTYYGGTMDPRVAFERFGPALGMTEQQMHAALAPTNNEGRMDAINTYDSGAISYGMFQWTARYEMQNLLGKMKEINPNEFQQYFGKYGFDVQRGPNGNVLSYNGQVVNAENVGQVLLSSQQEVDKMERIFYNARNSDAMQQAQWGLAKDRLDQIQSIRTNNGYTIGDYVSSGRGLAQVLDYHINRPAYVGPAFQEALRQLGNPAPGQVSEEQIIAAFERVRVQRNDSTLPQQRVDQINSYFNNLPNMAPPATSPTSPNPSQGSTYTVQQGDTLGRIAQRFGTTVAALQQANGIANPDRIQVGQTLVIPNQQTTTAPPVTSTTPAPPPPTAGSYTVRSGDTLFGIAQRFGTTVPALQQANGITNPNQIQAGQVLTLPNGSVTPPSNVSTLPVTPPILNHNLPSTTAQANSFFLTQWGPNTYNDPPGGSDIPFGYNDCGPTASLMALNALGITQRPNASDAHLHIDAMRDAILGWDTAQSQLLTSSQLKNGLEAHGATVTWLSSDQTTQAQLNQLDQALANGNPIILGSNTTYQAWGSSQNTYDATTDNYINSGDPRGHFATVLGRTANGGYIVGDPLVKGGTIEVTREQMLTALEGQWGSLIVSHGA
ncbi:LysM peptidoglycan-binding domain-containing protein [Myxococcota bacterium]|nr:LysM peptidoglycan-binding domain-containing protein [Myxococcota bacterium]